MIALSIFAKLMYTTKEEENIKDKLPRMMIEDLKWTDSLIELEVIATKVSNLFLWFPTVDGH